jgi:hypothetical protein
MPINSYAELKTSIAGYLQRSDLTAMIPQFIALAESDINADLADLPELLVHANATTAAGNPLVDTVNMWALRDAWCNGEPLSILQTNWQTTTDTSTGSPEAISIEGAAAIRIYPTPDAAYSIDVVYVPVISPSLAGGEPSDAATNWILQRHPGVYLYGSLLHASAYIEDAAKIGAWQQGYDGAIGRMRGANRQGHVTMRAESVAQLTRNTGAYRYV